MAVSIKAEGLSKKYLISHKNAGRSKYISLREELAGTAKKILKNDEELPKREEFWALKDVTFEIQQGERIGIIGSNGAGKSTLLKILSRITEPSEGKAMLKGRVGSLLEVGTGFHPELTGRENIYLNGAILGMTKNEIKRKFDEIVSFAEIEKFLDTPVKRYSSGMYVRLAFSVAAHLEPEILLVDEVLAVGDAAFQKKCIGKMESAGEDGRTILFVSHNMTAVKNLCGKVMLIKNGRLAEYGEASKVINTYLDLYKEETLEQEWNSLAEAPGNENIKIKSIRLIPALGTNGRITIETPLNIEIEFYNYAGGIKLNLSLLLWSISGECIFNVGTPAETVKEGIYKSVLHIPGNFLNDNTYSVELQFVKDQSYALFKKRDILIFEVHEQAREGGWFGKWLGAVRPKFKFELTQVN